MSILKKLQALYLHKCENCQHYKQYSTDYSELDCEKDTDSNFTEYYWMPHKENNCPYFTPKELFTYPNIKQKTRKTNTHHLKINTNGHDLKITGSIQPPKITHAIQVNALYYTLTPEEKQALLQATIDNISSSMKRMFD